MDTDSGSLSLLVRYKDGRGTSTDVTKVVTYSKAKAGVPNVIVAVSPTSQTLVSNSRGSGSALPVALTITALEGASSKFVSIGTPTYTGGLAGSVSTNTITFTSNASTMYSDTGNVTIPINYTDSENVSGTKTVVATVSKSKAAAPTTLAILSSETQTILSSSAGFAAPSSFTITLTEGGSSYSYDAGLSSNNTFYVSLSGGTGTTTITPTTPSSVSGITTTISIFYKNSEGTTGTLSKIHKVAVSLEGVKGNIGLDGKRTATGMVHYQLTSTSAPPSPTATSYDFVTNVFTGLTANWSTGAPTYASGNTNKYWYATHTTVETTAGGGTGTPSFGSSTQAIGFTGLVTFTSPDNITDGSNTSNIVTPGGVTNHIGGANVTTINGGKISTGVITSTGYTLPPGDTLASGTYTSAGTIFNLDNGSLRSKNFYINSGGSAFFRGDISAATGTFTGGISGTGYSLNNSGLSLTNANSSISLGNGVTLNSNGLSGTGFSLNTAGVSATQGAIGGWLIESTKLKSTDGITRLDSTNKEFAVMYPTNPIYYKVRIGAGTVFKSQSFIPFTEINESGFLMGGIVSNNGYNLAAKLQGYNDVSNFNTGVQLSVTSVFDYETNQYPPLYARILENSSGVASASPAGEFVGGILVRNDTTPAAADSVNQGFAIISYGHAYFNGPTTQIKGQLFASDLVVDSANTRAVRWKTNGYITTDSSSKRYKKNIESTTLEDAKRILNLRVVTYHEKVQKDTDVKMTGLIAEEVDDLGYKDFVAYMENGPETVNYQYVFASMLKVIQDLNYRVETLETQLKNK